MQEVGAGVDGRDLGSAADAVRSALAAVRLPAGYTPVARTTLGIAARNGILLIADFRHLEQVEGEPFGPALVVRGASERLSPNLMTALPRRRRWPRW